jgi:hypothetical protein
MWPQRCFSFAVEITITSDQRATRRYFRKAILDLKADFQPMMMLCRSSPQKIDRGSWFGHLGGGNAPRDLTFAVQIGTLH